MTELTYNQVKANWNLYERCVIDQVALHGETTYLMVVRRVLDYLYSDIRNFPPSLVLLSEEKQNEIREALLDARIVPASPILKYAAKEREGAYASGYSIPLNDTELISKIYKNGGTASIPYIPQGSTAPQAFSSLVDVYSENEDMKGRVGVFGVQVSEDTTNWESWLSVVHRPHITPVVSIPSNLSEDALKNLALAIHKRNNVTLLFEKNIKDKNTFSNLSLPLGYAPLIEYSGPKNTAAPVVFLNLSRIMAKSRDYDQFVRHVFHHAYLATIFCNMLLFDPSKYLTEELYTNNLKHRPIGISLTGLHGAMIRCDVPYHSPDAVEMASHAQAATTLGSMAASGDLMFDCPKTSRIGCEGVTVAQLARHCQEVTSPFYAADTFLHKTLRTLEKHGCLFNGCTTFNGIDPLVASIGQCSTPGVDPLMSIDITVPMGEENQITLVCTEIFDTNGTITADLKSLKNSTAPFIDPEQQIAILETLNELSMGSTYKQIVCPLDTSMVEISSYIKKSKDKGLKSLTLVRGTHAKPELKREEEVIVSEIEGEIIEEVIVPEINDTEFLDDILDSVYSIEPAEEEGVTLIETLDPAPIKEEKTKTTSSRNAMIYSVNTEREEVYIAIKFNTEDEPCHVMISGLHLTEEEQVILDLVNLLLKTSTLKTPELSGQLSLMGTESRHTFRVSDYSLRSLTHLIGYFIERSGRVDETST